MYFYKGIFGIEYPRKFDMSLNKETETEPTALVNILFFGHESRTCFELSLLT